MFRGKSSVKKSNAIAMCKKGESVEVNKLRSMCKKGESVDVNKLRSMCKKGKRGRRVRKAKVLVLCKPYY